jgi:hypothetical protein
MHTSVQGATDRQPSRFGSPIVEMKEVLLSGNVRMPPPIFYLLV